MKVIERLQQGRPEIVHVFDEMVRATPEGIFLTNLTQKGNVITIEGMSQSNARVSQMMRSLDSSDWFENPSLFIVTKEKAAKEAESDSRKFRLIVPQTPLEKTLAATQAKTQQGPSGETQPTAPAGENTPHSSSGGDQAAAPRAENAVSPTKTAPTNQR
jgi:type IV pilus assembly protein PilN